MADIFLSSLANTLVLLFGGLRRFLFLKTISEIGFISEFSQGQLKVPAEYNRFCSILFW